MQISFVLTLSILLLLFLILSSLGFALYYLIRDESKRRRTVSALTVRILLSLLLFLALFLAFALGWIKPHPLLVDKIIKTQSE